MLVMFINADFPVNTAQESQRYPAVCFVNDQYYVFWGDRRFYSEDTTVCLYAARVTTNGTVLDPDGKMLFRDYVTEKLDVAYDSTNFLVVFRNHC